MYKSIHIRQGKSIQELNRCADFLEGIEGPVFVGADGRGKGRRSFGVLRERGFRAVSGVLRKGSGRVGEWKCFCLLCLHGMASAQVGLRRQRGVAEISRLRGER